MNLLNWLAYILGIRGIDIEGVREVAFNFSAGSMAMMILAAVAIAGVAISIASYARTTESIASRKRVYFAIARTLVYTFLLLSLAGLALDLELGIYRKYSSLVLIDDSLSMGLKVEGTTSTRLDRAMEVLEGNFMSRLASLRGVSIRGLSGAEIDTENLGGLKTTADRTDIPATIDPFLRSREADGFSEIILVTDGRDTRRTSYQVMKVALLERGIKLYPILVANKADFKDVRLTAATTTPFCRAFDRLVIPFTLHQRGCESEQVMIEIFESGSPERILAKTEVTLQVHPTGQRGRLIFDPPRRSGDIHLVVRASNVPGELVTENNSAEVFTRVVDEPIRLLYIDNFPRAEVKHIKQSIDRDPNLSVTFLNRMPGGSWLVQGKNLLEKPELGFPAEIGELLKYDVLILGSISRGYFSAGDRFEERKLTNIARFVSGRGGGMVVLGGHRSFGHGKFENSPLDPLLPFEIYKQGLEEFQAAEIKAELTALGRYHPVVQLANSVEENLKTWQELPSLQGCNVVGKARPGVQVLAVSSKAIDGKKPIILASHQYGAGRVFACTTFSTFRWRLGTKSEKGNLLSRFWSQVIRYVSPDPRLLANSINILPDKPNYLRGDTASLLVRPLDAYFEPLRKADIYLTVQNPDETSIEFLLREDPSQMGMYPADLILEQKGTYEITASTAKDLKGHVTLIVRQSSEEFFDPRPHSDQLEMVAKETGGRLYTMEDAERIFDEMPDKPEVLTRRLEVPLWDSPLFLFLILGLCLGEWFFRKRSGLA